MIENSNGLFEAIGDPNTNGFFVFEEVVGGAGVEVIGMGGLS